jgi:hypothetical protein
MTVANLGDGRLMGLSSDTKPTTYPTGTTFFETDKVREFWFNGTNWKLKQSEISDHSYIIYRDPTDTNYKSINTLLGTVEFDSATANTVIQSTIDALVASYAGDANRAKGSIFIRNYNFYTGLDLTLKSKINLVGEGEGSIFTGKVTVQDASDNAGLYKMSLGTAADDHVLYLNGAQFFVARDCQFYLNNTTLTKYPVLLDGGTNFGTSALFDKCKIVSKGNGLMQRASATTKYNNTTTLKDCYVIYNPGGTATGGQIGLNFDGDGVEKNTHVENCYIESWDTAISLDEGQCSFENIWIDSVNTAGIDVTKAAIDQQNIYISVSGVSVTTQPLLVLGGRKFFSVSPNYGMVYDSRSMNPQNAWIEKYLIPRMSPLYPNGMLYGHGIVGEGLLTQITNSGALTNSGNYSLGSWCRYTSAGGGTDNAGFRDTAAAFAYRGWNPHFFAKMRIFDKANTRGWFGLFSVSTEPTGDDWLNAAHGFGLGWLAGATNWFTIHNDGTGATVYTDTGIALASDTIYTLELRFEDTPTARVGYSINESAMVFTTTELPAQQTALFPHFQVEETAAAAKLLDRFQVFIRPKSTA